MNQHQKRGKFSGNLVFAGLIASAAGLWYGYLTGRQLPIDLAMWFIAVMTIIVGLACLLILVMIGCGQSPGSADNPPGMIRKIISWITSIALMVGLAANQMTTLAIWFTVVWLFAQLAIWLIKEQSKGDKLSKEAK